VFDPNMSNEQHAKLCEEISQDFSRMMERAVVTFNDPVYPAYLVMRMVIQGVDNIMGEAACRRLFKHLILEDESKKDTNQ
jgi:hypothetical protein